VTPESARIRAEVALEQPQAALERAIIDEYLRSFGYEPELVKRASSPQMIALLAKAALYAGERLAEHEARAHFVQEIHGALTPTVNRSKLHV
jgi:hypothetical protein